MTDILDRLQAAMHEESAFHAPRTTKAVEAMREAKTEIARLRALIKTMLDEDPNDLAADGGVTVLDVWRKKALRALRADRTTEGGA